MSAAYRRAPGRRFRPEGKARNCCVPYERRAWQDFFSHARARVMECMTEYAPKDCAKRHGKGWLSTIPDEKLAAVAGVSRRTVRQTRKQAKELGFTRLWDTETRGKRRISTTYHVLPWDEPLKAIRENPAYYKTAAGHVVGVGRNPQIMTPEDAALWKITKDAPPPPCRPVFSDVTNRRAKQTATGPLDVERVMDAFRRAQAPVDEKTAVAAIAIAQRAYTEMGESGQINAATVEALILQIAREYKPNAEFREPKPGWFIGKRKNTGKIELAERVKAWVAQQRPEQHARTG